MGTNNFEGDLELDAKIAKHKKMTETPVEGLIVKMAIPTIISMLISTFYSMVDTLYVGHMNTTSATATIGVAFSFMAFIQAVGFFFGHGSGNSISRELGKKNIEEASKMAAIGFFSALFTGVIIMISGLIFLNPLVRLLGATDTALPYSREYIRLILIGTPYMMASFVMNNQLRLQGNAFLGMIGISAGAIFNIILDPILIFGLHMGVTGAALATIISQFISFLLLLYGCGRKDNLKIRISNFSPSIRRYKNIFGGGFPSLCRQGLASIATICLNQAAGIYGDAAIAAFAVVNRVTTFAGAALLGFGQGFQPVCGFNYGAGLFERVGKAFWFCIKVSTICLSVLGVLGFLFAPQIISLFGSEDQYLIEIGVMALRYQCITFPILGWVIMTSMLLQNIGKTGRASVLALARQGIFFLPSIFILPSLLNITGVELVQPIADMLTFVLSLPLGISVLNEMKYKSKTDSKKIWYNKKNMYVESDVMVDNL